MNDTDIIRIRYQSFVDDTLAGPYLKKLGEQLTLMAGSNTHIEIATLTPPDSYAHAVVEYRCGYQTMRNAILAEREGFDAFVIGHFQDAGLSESKSLVDIPVLGLGEISMLYACTLGQRIALVTINPRFIPWHQQQIVKYGLEDRITEVCALSFEPGDFMHCFESAEHYDKVKSLFCEQARGLVQKGIDVIIPAGGIPMLVLLREKGFNIDGVPVLNGLPVLVKMAELNVSLHRNYGIAVSRSGLFSKVPPEIVEEILTAP